MVEEKKCIICESLDTELKYKDYPGYIENTFYDILKCRVCGSHYINTEKIDSKIYSRIYSSEDLDGYDRYYKYAKNLKGFEDPLKYLAMNESIYYFIYKYVENINRTVNILEVGCGYGYLTYSLNKIGLNATGLDVAKPAIDFAKEHFGDYYNCSSIELFAKETGNKYDLIISTEVIEHTPNPKIFINQLLSLLNDNGKVLLTTPNKDYFSDDALWVSTKPPVHTMWLTKKSIVKLATGMGLSFKLHSYRKDYYPKFENQLIRYFRFRKEPNLEHIVDGNGQILNKVLANDGKLYVFIKKLFFENSTIRNICNFIYNKFLSDDITLSFELWKKSSKML
ncbi:MAG: methyltransferase domain-containing protein [Arcobacter sp.]|nr:methyltransferase domain-containing protein [Arcobacter sp.]